MKILITGVAGFIGYHLACRFLREGHCIIGVDNLNNYYDPALKKSRLENIKSLSETLDKVENFKFIKLDISDRVRVEQLFVDNQFDIVVNLAAQAGVRYSIENPHAYVESNLVGFVNILEGCRSIDVKNFIYASSSSVYGMNVKQPFSVGDNVDHPVSLYAATKKSNELMAHAYSHLYKIPSTGLRFFTVYGPWGRPDMAYFKFTKAIINGETIDVYNNGLMQRDFTYIDDIIEGMIRIASNKDFKVENPHSKSTAHHRVYNIGNNQPVSLREFISLIERSCGKKAIEKFLPMQAGDVPITYANIDPLVSDIGFKPSFSFEEGIEKFVSWYKNYFV